MQDYHSKLDVNANADHWDKS